MTHRKTRCAKRPSLFPAVLRNLHPWSVVKALSNKLAPPVSQRRPTLLTHWTSEWEDTHEPVPPAPDPRRQRPSRAGRTDRRRQIRVDVFIAGADNPGSGGCDDRRSVTR